MFEMSFDYDEEAFFSLLNRRLRDFGDDLASDTAEDAASIAQQLAESEVNSRTGEYHSSFFWRPAVGGSSATVGNDSDKAVFIEKGTQPHGIDGNPWLAFDKEGGSSGVGQLQPLFGRAARKTVVKHVNHPGSRAFRIIERATLRALRSRNIRARGTS